ncbi:hypothetical protein G9F71_006240 [Clostridium sp. FP2]|uniref:hypothetical protein n=1 Tax=Clostridium sp. FP2 TaxID=2724481 RepID=UPI001CCD1F84|nr:hypothetical protein [Clostridium sp. FP2]MBZ9622449.1 hypothetical protein [Clostridium sp. FP2]
MVKYHQGGECASLSKNGLPDYKIINNSLNCIKKVLLCCEISRDIVALDIFLLFI